MTISSTLRIAVVAAFASLAVGGAASAETWSRAHPRRAEVNHRLANQNLRIRTERKEGEITGAQARKLHREDRFVRNEERFMASQHGGHITRAEKRALSQQENGVSRQIGQ
jgi:Flp pilus assembly protein TadB